MTMPKPSTGTIATPGRLSGLTPTPQGGKGRITPIGNGGGGHARC